MPSAAGPARKIRWPNAWRVIPTRYPKTNVYARVAPAEDMKAVIETEALTNPRTLFIRKSVSFLRPTDELAKNASRHLIAPFTKPRGGRFSDSTMGCCYVADALATAVHEKMYHHKKFMADSHLPPMRLEMTALVLHVEGFLDDIRGLHLRLPELYRLNDYSKSILFGRKRWTENSDGIVYDSVRLKGGECSAVYRPQSLTHVREERCLLFDWDGRSFTPNEVLEYPRPKNA